MDRVAEGLHGGGDLRGHLGADRPDVLGGERHQGGESAVGVDPDDPGVGADVVVAAQALGAAVADEVGFDRDPVADPHPAVHPLAERHHLAADLVAHDPGQVDPRLGPGVPVVEMDVGATDRGGEHPEQDLARAGGRLLHVGDGDAGPGGVLDDSAHGAPIMSVGGLRPPGGRAARGDALGRSRAEAHVEAPTAGHHHDDLPGRSGERGARHNGGLGWAGRRGARDGDGRVRTPVHEAQRPSPIRCRVQRARRQADETVLRVHEIELHGRGRARQLG